MGKSDQMAFTGSPDLIERSGMWAVCAVSSLYALRLSFVVFYDTVMVLLLWILMLEGHRGR